ncbi:hypothetical protein LL946_00230 [Knoellia locipacati]|uniref:hypothetical protein n=1 Tax=Knoellia locipacati TaxID=882824 RepID=UPI00384D925F
MPTPEFLRSMRTATRNRAHVRVHHQADVFRGDTGSWCWSCRCGAGANAGRTRTDHQWMSAAALLHEAARPDP